ncbi:MAG: ABC transporter permease [Chloroflexi bacterium]|nr:ABC transporter permease [Chloroflexota bacterium]
MREAIRWPIWPRLVFVAALLGAWLFLTNTARVSPLLLPKLPLVGAFLKQLVLDGNTYKQIGLTLMEFAASFVMSCAAAFLVGFLIGSYRYAVEVFEPILVALYAVPIIIIYPLCILFFGLGHSSKIAFSAIYGFFPITINVINGLKNVDRGLLRVSLTMGANPIQLLWKVLVPGAFPLILNGIRLALVLEFLSTVAGETLAGRDGLGARISETSESLSAPELFGWILVTILVSYLISQLVGLLSRLGGERA